MFSPRNSRYGISMVTTEDGQGPQIKELTSPFIFAVTLCNFILENKLVHKTQKVIMQSIFFQFVESVQYKHTSDIYLFQ